MNKDTHALWTEKFRPTTLKDYIFHDDAQRASIERMVADGTIPHLLLSGIQGSGKTTLAKVLINELDIDEMDTLILNASDENSVDTMREKIKNFISSMAMGTFKVVLLDEADYISLQGQGILRNMMETYNEQARFILTCNYDNKIIPQIKSRSQQFKFSKGNKVDITEFVAKILIKEKVKFDLELLDKYVDVGYPDVRKIINMLQQNSNNGVLQAPQTDEETGDYKFKLLELMGSNDWTAVRKIACENVTDGEWEDLYKFLYENLQDSPKFVDQKKWDQGIILIAEHLYKHAMVADPEINAAALFIQLEQI